MRTQNLRTLQISNITVLPLMFHEMCSGSYKCIAENRQGEVESGEASLDFKGSDGSPVFLVTPNDENVKVYLKNFEFLI